uniref:Peptidase C1A papain C-terminal domain-containing protein n=1 Tax=Lactuca sativa TaxID=4236 RepID=A0A9R1X1F4_LACSA|nr:hypothetical protein LSAT_V11C800445140 [Lactuca sativa]
MFPSRASNNNDRFRRWYYPYMAFNHLQVSDGERLPLAVKELGTCDLYPQVSFFSDDEETTSTPKADALFIPRENPRALVIRPLKQWPGKSSAEKLKNASSPAQTNGDYTGFASSPPLNGRSMENGNSINTEVAYPYQAADGTCNTKEEAVHAATITRYEKVPANSESALLQAVANQPVSVAIDASGMGFQFYSGGVFTGDFGIDLDHGVTSLLNQMELYVVVYILAILGLDSLQGIMLDQGSCIDTCCTFCRKFFKLSPEESSKDPLYLLRDMDAMGYKRGHFVLIAKIIISALGYLMLGTFIYVLIVDGSTFNVNVLSRYEKLQRWDDALKAYTAKSAQATSQRLILDATLGNSYCSVFIPNPKFFGWRKGSQELSEQGFNISLKEI